MSQNFDSLVSKSCSFGDEFGSRDAPGFGFGVSNFGLIWLQSQILASLWHSTTWRQISLDAFKAGLWLLICQILRWQLCQLQTKFLFRKIKIICENLRFLIKKVWENLRFWYPLAEKIWENHRFWKKFMERRSNFWQKFLQIRLNKSAKITEKVWDIPDFVWTLTFHPRLLSNFVPS